jgi:AmmeMemoRadiSam system protein A
MSLGTARSASAALGAVERRVLLRTARDSIAAHFAGGSAATGEPIADQPRRGVFVSLHRRADGELRGCVGMMEAERPLGETVARMAVAAATEDRRFAPVTAEELPDLEIEISVLSPPAPIRGEEVEVGRHGLLIEHEGRRGVLLPQVPVAHKWGREEFLDQTCRKAGLPAGSWREPGARLLGFTAEVFGEDEP